MDIFKGRGDASVGELFCMDQAGGLDCLHEEYESQFDAVISETQGGVAS